MNCCSLRPVLAPLALVGVAGLALQTGDRGTAAVLLGLLPILAVLALVCRFGADRDLLSDAITWLRRRWRAKRRRSTITIPAGVRPITWLAPLPTLANATRGPPA